MVLHKAAAMLRAVGSCADRWVACVGQAVPGALWASAPCRRLPAAAAAAAPNRLPARHGSSAALRMRCRASAREHAAEPQRHAPHRGYADGPAQPHALERGQDGAPRRAQVPSAGVRTQAGSAERYLTDVCGVPESAVDGVIRRAVTWRVTAGGRNLIDRRHRSRVERNMPIVAAYLTDVCGIAPGRSSTAHAVPMHPALTWALAYAAHHDDAFHTSGQDPGPVKLPVVTAVTAECCRTPVLSCLCSRRLMVYCHLSQSCRGFCHLPIAMVLVRRGLHVKTASCLMCRC